MTIERERGKEIKYIWTGLLGMHYGYGFMSIELCDSLHIGLYKMLVYKRSYS